MLKRYYKWDTIIKKITKINDTFLWQMYVAIFFTLQINYLHKQALAQLHTEY